MTLRSLRRTNYLYMNLYREAEQEYEVFVDDVNIGRMTTNLGGKLVLSVELGSAQKHVKVVRV